MATKPHFELPDFYLPWPARLNPHVEGARAQSRAWAHDMGFIDPPPEDEVPKIWTEKKLDTMDVGLFCAYSHPDALPHDLELITDWIVWAFYFDDYFLEVFKRAGDGKGLRAMLDRLGRFMNVDVEAAAPEPTNPMERGLLDLWRRTVPAHTLEWRRRFREATLDMLYVVEWELRNIKAGRVANPIEFVQWRRPAGGAAWTVYFVEHANLAEVPDRVWKERPIRVLVDTFADGVHYRNDLFSYEREVNEEGELSNFVIVLQHFFGLDAQAAANMTNDLLSSRLYQFEHTAATEVPVMFEEKLLTPPERAAVALYVKGLQDWQAGCHEWHLRSSRYTKPTRSRSSFLSLPTSLSDLGTSALRLFHASPESTGLTRLRAYTHVPHRQVGPVALPATYMPFASRLNSAHTTVRRTTKEWARAMGMLDPAPGPPGAGLWSEAIFDAFDLTQLVARVFPDAHERALELAVKGFILGVYLDDYFWRHFQSTRDLAGAKAYLARIELFLPLDGTVTPPPLDAAERALVDLWPHVIAQLSPERRLSARARLLEMLGSWLWEIEGQVQNRVADPIDYFEMRRVTLGFDFVLGLIDSGLTQRIPPRMLAAQTMVELRNAAADCVSLHNDLVSFQAEEQYEGVHSNGVIVAESFLRISIEQALHVVNDLLGRRMQQLETIIADELPRVADQLELDDDARAALSAYVDTLIHWVAGCHDWQVASGRYASELLPQRYTVHTVAKAPASGLFAAQPSGLGTEAAALAGRLSGAVEAAAWSTPSTSENDVEPAARLPEAPSGPDHPTGHRSAAADAASAPEAAELRPLPSLPSVPLSEEDEAAAPAGALDLDARGALGLATQGSASLLARSLARAEGRDAGDGAHATAPSLPTPPKTPPPGAPAAPELPHQAISRLSSSVRRRQRRPTVAVLGGGIAGLTAAHELIERGFAVDVYERKHWGGKARSTGVRGTGKDGRRPLPAEHGYRVEFGFYQNIPDLMRRIPFEGNANGVFDNLVETPQTALLRRGKRDVVIPFGPSDPLVRTPRQTMDMFAALLSDRQVPAEAVAHFARRMTVFCSSCDARRSDEWEAVTWNEFIGARDFTEDYYKLFGGASFLIQAAKPENTSAKITGWFLELILQSLCGRGSNGPTSRMLNQPTSIAWIDPWVSRLEQLGARMHLGAELKRLELEDGRIVGAELETPSGKQPIMADYYVCALPLDRARKLWTDEILAADPALSRAGSLHLASTIGLQFYMRERLRLVAGAANCVDSPWKVVFVHQAQLWSSDFASTFGDGSAQDCLSVIISDWNAPGILYGKPASACNRDEMAREAWEQIKTHVNKRGRPPRLSDDMVVGWTIDDGLLDRGGRLVSDDQLPLAITRTERYRPSGATGIRNLVLAGDYLKGAWEIGTMESACFYGRLAANLILERAGSLETPATAIGPYRPPEWQLLKQIDAQRYANGEPNLFDGDGPPREDAARLLDGGGAISDALRGLEKVEIAC